MYTLNRIETNKRPMSKLLVFILSLSISTVLLITAVKFTLNFTPLYRFDVEYLKIDALSGMAKEDILNNYNVLIKYLRPSYKGELQFPTLPMSEQGKIHFVEVKNIFVTFEYIMYGAVIIALISLIYCLKRKHYGFLGLSSLLLIILPAALAIPFAVNFDRSFTVFHKIFFRNDYWEFNPKTDPVINILPQDFFFHCALLILIIITLESIMLYALYRRSNRPTRFR
jgi:integral membrane protein (TIGR01906 family)